MAAVDQLTADWALVLFEPQTKEHVARLALRHVLAAFPRELTDVVTSATGSLRLVALPRYAARLVQVGGWFAAAPAMDTVFRRLMAAMSPAVWHVMPLSWATHAAARATVWRDPFYMIARSFEGVTTLRRWLAAGGSRVSPAAAAEVLLQVVGALAELADTAGAVLPRPGTLTADSVWLAPNRAGAVARFFDPAGGAYACVPRLWAVVAVPDVDAARAAATPRDAVGNDAVGRFGEALASLARDLHASLPRDAPAPAWWAAALEGLLRPLHTLPVPAMTAAGGARAALARAPLLARFAEPPSPEDGSGALPAEPARAPVRRAWDPAWRRPEGTRPAFAALFAAPGATLARRLYLAGRDECSVCLGQGGHGAVVRLCAAVGPRVGCASCVAVKWGDVPPKEVEALGRVNALLAGRPEARHVVRLLGDAASPWHPAFRVMFMQNVPADGVAGGLGTLAVSASAADFADAWLQACGTMAALARRGGSTHGDLGMSNVLVSPSGVRVARFSDGEGRALACRPAWWVTLVDWSHAATPLAGPLADLAKLGNDIVWALNEADARQPAWADHFERVRGVASWDEVLADPYFDTHRAFAAAEAPGEAAAAAATEEFHESALASDGDGDDEGDEGATELGWGGAGR